ncbi:glycosyltransferase [Streptomyces sp. NPDC060194]|uniref:glycosyltransferase n=1 Tax=Streptomyces sp. NPDC060194 TaxID=3347069 RepID=UPI00364AFEF5
MTQQDTYAPAAEEAGRGRRKRRQLKVSYFVFLGLAFLVATRLDAGSLHLYSIGAMGLLSLKMIGALFYRPAKAGREELEYIENSWVTAVIPIYNEDPVTFEQGLRSLLAQSRLPNEIHIIDDASADPGGIRMARRLAKEFEAKGVKYLVSVQKENKGKREALALGFEAAPYTDIFLCVDSDTILSRDTVRELLIPLADEEIMASTGMVLALNHDTNIFTRLQDLRYGNSFLFERAAYSRLKSVLCCCGALSAYRGTLVRKYLPDFLNQQFLGKPAVFGDDRRMTNYCLIEGKVVFQETAVGYTAVPEKIPHFLRQQVRWNKSFFRESLWAFRNQPKSRPAFWLTVMELTLWLVFGSAMFYSMVILPIIKPEQFLNHIGDYAIFMVIMGYLRNVRYLDFPRRGMGFVKRFGMFLLAPIYGLIQLTLLTPLRFYALFTLHSGSWGTRQGGVEVSMAGGEEELASVWEEEDPYSDPEAGNTLQLMRLQSSALAKTMPPRQNFTPNPNPLPPGHPGNGPLPGQGGAPVPQQRVAWGAPQPGQGPQQPAAPAAPQPAYGQGAPQQPAYGQQQWAGGQQPRRPAPQQAQYPYQQQPQQAQYPNPQQPQQQYPQQYPNPQYQQPRQPSPQQHDPQYGRPPQQYPDPQQQHQQPRIPQQPRPAGQYDQQQEYDHDPAWQQGQGGRGR